MIETKDFTRSAYLELESKHTKLEQAVKDAIAEMDKYYSLKLGIRIIKEKTGL